MAQGNRKRAVVALVVAGSVVVGGATVAQQAPMYTAIGGGGYQDGIQATSANMNGAGDIVFDAAGNAYISQFSGNRIRKISPAGVITTVVGGVTGFSGDNGPASAAAIDRPSGLELDAAGNLYFVDAGNHRVRRIATNGVITTVAGNGTLVHSGDGGLAVNAGFAAPSGLAIDGAGNLFVSDSTSHRVRKITTGGMISTVAGTGTAGYAGDNAAATSALLTTPLGLDTDAAGNLYIADLGSGGIGAIRRVATNGIITTVLSNVSALNVAAYNDGSLFFGDLTTCTLARLNGMTVTKNIAGVDYGCKDGPSGGPASAASIGGPDGIAFDTVGNIVFVDTDYARVRQATVSSGLISVFAGVGGNFANGIPAIGAPLSNSMAIAVEANGNVVISDALVNKRVRRIYTNGTIATIGGNGTISDSATLPASALQLTFLQGYGMAIGPNGTVWVGDRGKNRIVSIDSANNATLVAGVPRAPGSGNGDNGPATQASIDPFGLARDNGGTTYVADYAGHRIRRIDIGGTITTWAGTGVAGFNGDNGPATSAQINSPMAVATDAQGNVYFSDVNLRVRKITVAGLITTIAGNGQDGVTGDGGLATDAAIGNVRSIAVDDTGVVYIGSSGRLRRILANGRIESLPGWTHYVSALAIRNGQLYVTTQEGLVYRLPLAARRVANDYDGDGKSDLAWRNVETGADTVWKAASSANTMTVMGVNNTAWKIVGQGDFDGDGKSDLVWRNGQSGANSIWRSADYNTPITVVGVTNLQWSIDGVGDFDGDGKSDLLWRNGTTGQNVVWHSGNAATQTMLSAVPGGPWRIVGVGDFDGDGKSDIVWRNTSTGMHSLWRSGNSATTQPMTGVTTLSWKIVGVGDFDGDGKSDVVWRNTANGTNAIWRSADSTQQIPVVGVTSQLWRIVSVGDYDGDGKSDLLWRNTGNGSNALWRSGDAGAQLPVTGVTNQAWTIVPYENQP